MMGSRRGFIQWGISSPPPQNEEKKESEKGREREGEIERWGRSSYSLRGVGARERGEEQRKEREGDHNMLHMYVPRPSSTPFK